MYFSGRSVKLMFTFTFVTNVEDKETETQRAIEKNVMTDMVIIFFFIPQYKKNSTQVEFSYKTLEIGFLSDLIKIFTEFVSVCARDLPPLYREVFIRTG